MLRAFIVWLFTLEGSLIWCNIEADVAQKSYRFLKDISS